MERKVRDKEAEIVELRNEITKLVIMKKENEILELKNSHLEADN